MQKEDVRTLVVSKAPEWMTIVDICANLPNIRKTNIYVHLWELVKEGAVEKKKEGRKAFYRARDKSEPVITIVKAPADADFVSETTMAIPEKEEAKPCEATG